ncbi:MAG TPA: SIS domain-containing protein [Conexibacter sp.]|nr:SIS domain-containing protein [Conexibacter sp.]
MSTTTPLGAVMAEEMGQQPDVLRRLLAQRPAIEAALRAAAPSRPAGISLLARGTSDHAAIYGRYLLEAATGVPVSLVAPSLWTRYERHADLGGHLLIALSQSGRTPEIERVVRVARAGGATVLAITNEGDSPLANAAQHVVALRAGLERAVPATKTFTAQLAAIALVAGALAPGGLPELDALAQIPALQEELLEDGERVAPIAERLAAARAVVTVGSGFLYAVALESALKLLETTSLPVLAYSASDFVHGPVAVAGPDVPVVCFATDGPVRADVSAAVAAAAGRGAPVAWVGPRPAEAEAEHVPVPGDVPEMIGGLLHAIRAQQLALEASRALGVDPDAPRGLRKVTPTT